MALYPTQARYIERFFPGLIKELEALGNGEFECQPSELYQAGNNGIHGAKLRITRNLDSGYKVSIKVFMGLKGGEKPFCPTGPDDMTPVDLSKWDTLTYSLKLISLSLEKALEEGRIFAADQHGDGRGHHVHLPYTKEHVLAKDAIPDTTNMPPIDFVRAVGLYLIDKRCPIRKKT